MKAVWRPVSMRRMGALGTSPASTSITIASAHSTASSAAHARRRRAAPASCLLLARALTVMVLLDFARGRCFVQCERAGADVFAERTGAEIIVAQAQSAHVTRRIDDVITHPEYVRYRAAHQRAAAEVGGLRHAAPAVAARPPPPPPFPPPLGPFPFLPPPASAPRLNKCFAPYGLVNGGRG